MMHVSVQFDIIVKNAPVNNIDNKVVKGTCLLVKKQNIDDFMFLWSKFCFTICGYAPFIVVVYKIIIYRHAPCHAMAIFNLFDRFLPKFKLKVIEA